MTDQPTSGAEGANAAPPEASDNPAVSTPAPANEGAAAPAPVQEPTGAAPPAASTDTASSASGADAGQQQDSGNQSAPPEKEKEAGDRHEQESPHVGGKLYFRELCQHQAQHIEALHAILKRHGIGIPHQGDFEGNFRQKYKLPSVDRVKKP